MTVQANPEALRDQISKANQKISNDMETIDQQVRQIAHQIYENRTREGKCGDALSDWLEAEKHVLNNLQ